MLPHGTDKQETVTTSLISLSFFQQLVMSVLYATLDTVVQW